MAYALYVDVIPPEGGRVAVTHIFWGETEAAAHANFDAHAAGCQFLGPAIAEDRIEEELERVRDAEWPEYDPPGEDDEEEAGESEEDEEPEEA